jgi:hypothetical protein
MYLVGIIYNLNFVILIFNEIYRRNRRSIREMGGSKKLTLIQAFLGSMGEFVTLVVKLHQSFISMSIIKCEFLGLITFLMRAL